MKQMSSYSRRTFVKGIPAAGLLALAEAHGQDDEVSDSAEKQIQHVVVVTMENRSLDHLLGWLPNIDGKQAGLQYTDRAGVLHTTHPLAPDFQGCGHPDPDHSYAGGRVEFNGGACNGWLRAGQNDDYAIGYYTQPDLAFLGHAAPRWTTFSRYFAATMAETYPNRIYMHAAQTDRATNTSQISTLPTIWDRLIARGIPCRYYYSDVPFLALWGAKYLPISRPVAGFLADCATGQLPAVSFVDPRFLDESSGTSGDDHPHGDIRNGEAFLNRVYSAVTGGPDWPTTVLVITFDEWGGFFDHVPPQTAPDVNPAMALRGFRVPCLMVAPWARRRFVATNTYDHTSILKMIEWRWGLQPLTVRDAKANNLASVLDLRSRNMSSPQFAVPPGPFGAACSIAPSVLAPVQSEWTPLLNLARGNGWPV